MVSIPLPSPLSSFSNWSRVSGLNQVPFIEIMSHSSFQGVNKFQLIPFHKPFSYTFSVIAPHSLIPSDCSSNQDNSPGQAREYPHTAWDSKRASLWCHDNWFKDKIQLPRVQVYVSKLQLPWHNGSPSASCNVNSLKARTLPCLGLGPHIQSKPYPRASY